MLFRAVGPFSVGYIPRGPLASELSATEIAQFARAIDSACRRRRAIAILVEPESAGLSLSLGQSPLWKPTDVLVQPQRTIKVALDGNDDDLLGRMKPKTRYNIRLAERRGVTIRRGGVPDIHLFFTLLRETADRDGFGVHEIAYFDDMLRVFGDDAVVFLAEFEGEPAAALLALRSPREAIYMYGATRTALQKHMPAYLIQFAAMKWARDGGCKTYDLWGIPANDEESPQKDASGSINVRDGMWGVYRFKLGFGGEVVSYPGVFERVYIQPLMRAWRMMRPNLI
jgi:lipid II:glycine glycyltransferase (peptidoglycan interpeptide bridge formation enzyme)